MTNAEKQLLLKDLCARLIYGVKAHTKIGTNITVLGVIDDTVKDETEDSFDISFIKPYLRPMSSMTEEEEEESKQVIELELKHLESEEPGHTIISAASSAFEIDFYNKHHFDYRGLIPMGLALVAPEGMY